MLGVLFANSAAVSSTRAHRRNTGLPVNTAPEPAKILMKTSKAIKLVLAVVLVLLMVQAPIG